MWQLKKNQPPFEMVDGPMVGRSFSHGIGYQEIPDGLNHRFEHSGEVIIEKMRQEETAAAAVNDSEPQPTESARTKGQKKDKEMTDA